MKRVLFSVFLLLIIFGCASKLARKKGSAIEITHQQLFLRPLKGIEKLKISEYWPDSTWQEKFLIKNMEQFWKNLLGEFRRCEKYGLFTMVDSTAPYTVEIIPEVINSKINEDTLFIFLKLHSFVKDSKIRNITTVKEYGLLKNSNSSTISDLVSAFTDYRRRFPYEKVVSSYYSDVVH